MKVSSAVVLAVLMIFAPSAARAQNGPTSLTATEIAAKVRSGELSSEALVTALIERAKATKNLNAFITLDEKGAIKAAREADALAKAKKWKGPLHGVPIVVKDNIHVAGLPNTAGTPALRRFVPRAHAPVVKKLIDAGAIVLGKTNMHELAFGITSNNAAFGAVGNPYEPTRIAGGSSGGTGAAIAARLVPAGLGTDTGGSVRIPSAVNGIVGLRPTLGRYPQEGITPIAHTRDTAGLMARSVADVVLLDAVISGVKGRVRPASLKGLRIGVPRKYFYDNLDAATQRLMEAALAKMKEAGIVLVQADIPDLADLNRKVSFPIALYEVTVDLPKYLKRYGIPLDFRGVAAQVASPDVKGLFDALAAGKPPSVPRKVYEQAIKVYRPKLKAAYANYFASQRVAAIVFPTTPLPAAPIGDDNETVLNDKKVPTFVTFIRNTDPGSNAGIPGLSIPIGMTQSGLPVGMELDGPAGSDRRLLAIGLALEKLFGALPAPRR
ncbi:MAG: indoleacetamide hydrolase [Armatimonadota bacterium]|nr:indoleacetamide hydrolase [Armatimonadota bacterium]MDR7486756.1 indoleacetamide hydrolase [Armatimonadota bacterium]MDR7533227.1 indoleacetamide hydrolase [Armatimonadota bacterium]MDR7535385.1 indoleacetamide hydrolase [Armatimonadota bacterium]